MKMRIRTDKNGMYVDCHSIRRWNCGDTDKPTGARTFPRVRFAEMTDEIAEAIENINRKTPRCGGHIDPWYRAKQHAIEVGCVVEMIVCASVAGLDADKES